MNEKINEVFIKRTDKMDSVSRS